MKVLVADPFEQSGLDGLAAAGCDVVFEPALKDDALATALRETRAEVLVVRSTKVTAPMMDGGDLALIVRAGAGYNTIDVTAASARGVYVSNCPGKNAAAVAELAIGLIIALDRRIADNVAELRAGRWDKSAFAKAKGLEGRTLGLLGFGTIAQEVARRAQGSASTLSSGHGGSKRRRRVRRLTSVRSTAMASIHPVGGVACRLPDLRGRRVRGRHPEHPSRPCRGDARSRRRRRHRTAAARRDPREHLACRGPRPRRTRRCRARARDPGRPGRVPRRADDRNRGIPPAAIGPARRLRHAPHRRIHRAGAGGDRRRDGPDRPGLSRDRAGAERRQSRAADAGQPPACRSPPKPAGGPRPRVRKPACAQGSTSSRQRT